MNGWQPVSFDPSTTRIMLSHWTSRPHRHWIKGLAMPVLAMMAMVACKHEPPAAPIDPGGGGGGGGSTNPCHPDTVYFERDILPILVSNCTMSGCHGGSSPADGIDLTNYTSLMAADVVRPYDLGRDLFEAITENDPDKLMPPPPRPWLTNEQVDLIERWIMQGAQNNTCGGGPCDTLNVTYSGTIAPLVQQRCIGCHSGATPQAGLNLGSWSVLNALAADGRLSASINHAPGAPAMPPSGPKLPDCNIRQFMLWIEAGAPNN